MECKQKDYTNQHKLSERNIQRQKCAMFDINESKWIPIKDYMYYADDNDFRCGLYNDSSVVYMVSSMLGTAIYDIKKNKWLIKCDQEDLGTLSLNTQPLVWLDNKDMNILYCARKTDFRYFDMRNSDKKWQKMDNIDMLLKNPKYLFL